MLSFGSQKDNVGMASVAGREAMQHLFLFRAGGPGQNATESIPLVMKFFSVQAADRERIGRAVGKQSKNMHVQNT